MERPRRGPGADVPLTLKAQQGVTPEQAAERLLGQIVAVLEQGEVVLTAAALATVSPILGRVGRPITITPSVRPGCFVIHPEEGP